MEAGFVSFDFHCRLVEDCVDNLANLTARGKFFFGTGRFFVLRKKCKWSQGQSIITVNHYALY